MRFDTEEGLFSKTKEGFPILVPGKPGESELFLRITDPDPDERMPPKDSHLSLTDDEIATVKAWIEQGAEWQGHWSFIPPVRRPLPDVEQEDWVRNPIDRFTLSRMEAHGLSPSPEAPKETLIRRVTLDLTGLPPTIAEVDAFLADERPDAYERVVDRLLASPQYGERMSFVWLDAARYSDTNGYQRDTKRTMWPWRDWVIEAFNENMPFDQFTIEQLAGDMLPEPTVDQIVATGFNRNHRINGEGGIIPEEYAVEYVVDRVDTTGLTWMGMTMGCARCHDHKFDPISQEEFFEFYAFFNNVPEEGKGRERGNDKPFIQVPTEAEREKRDRLTAELARLEEELHAPDARLDREQWAWEGALYERLSALDWRAQDLSEATSTGGAQIEVLADRSALVSGPSPAKDTHHVTIEPAGEIRAFRLEYFPDDRLPSSGPGRAGNGNLVLTDFSLCAISDSGERRRIPVAHGIADYRSGNADYGIEKAIDDDPASGWTPNSQERRESTEAYFFLADSEAIAPGETVLVSLGYESKHGEHTAGRFRLSASRSNALRAWTTPELGPWRYVGPLTAREGDDAPLDTAYGPESGFDADATYGDEGLQWKEKSIWTDGNVIRFKPEENTLNYVSRTVRLHAPTKIDVSLGSGDSVKVWVNGELRHRNGTLRKAEADQDSLSLMLPEGEHEILMKIYNAGNTSGFYFRVANDPAVDFLALQDLVSKPFEIRTARDLRELRTAYRMQDGEWLKAETRRKQAQVELANHERSITTTMVMEEMETPRTTYLLERGEYDKPDTSQQLFPSVPAALGEMPEDLPRNRLGLAKWILDPGHPLTARVRVNHYWQMYFGRGIVSTSDDFGTQGTPPSHPDLLDWLALHFIDSGWDVKAMQKLIVMSATYRQDSKLTKRLLEADPANVYLARAPRMRLPAEMIRDQALKVSGLLNEDVGGPSVFPYQPEGVWSALTFQNMDEYATNFYTEDTGDALYRRGLYTYWKRTIPPVRMQIFNAADRERCTLRLETTNTPMQAMVLLNDPTYVEAARHLATRMIFEGGKRPEERLEFGYRLVLAEHPDEQRQRILLNGLEDYVAHFTAHPDAAAELVGVGESAVESFLPPTQVAAYTMVASVLLNLDETITRE